MAAITWAKSVNCDYPDCKSTGDVTLKEEWPDRVLPAGWLDVRAHMVSLQNPFGVQFNEFCSIHADYPLSNVVAAIGMERTRGNSDSGT
jgi:hypothetical protein